MIRRLAAITTLASLLVPAPTSADAATDALVVLRDGGGTHAWDGAFAVGVGAPQEFALRLDLPAGTWRRPGGVQVAIDWFPDEQSDLDLFVLDARGRLVARSDGVLGSTGESVRLREADNGVYRIVVVPRIVVNPLRYRGFVEVEREPQAEPRRDLLPNLVSLPPRNPTLRTGAYLLDHGVAGTPSCYPEEAVERGARRCLRFDQVVANRGEGPLELRYRMDGIATNQALEQRIYASDGSHRDVTADSYEFHPTHAHFHYKSFGQARLYAVRRDGSWGLVREGRKNGFCMIDVENTRFGLDRAGRPYQGEAPRTYYFPRCNAPTERDRSGVAMVNGISAGWADVYNWFVADQYIEISGVPDGRYVLEAVANPTGSVSETSTKDNRAHTVIQIRGDTVTVVAAREDRIDTTSKIRMTSVASSTWNSTMPRPSPKVVPRSAWSSPGRTRTSSHCRSTRSAARATRASRACSGR